MRSFSAKLDDDVSFEMLWQRQAELDIRAIEQHRQQFNVYDSVLAHVNEKQSPRIIVNQFDTALLTSKGAGPDL